MFFPFSIKSTCSADSVTDRADLRDWNDTLPPFGRLENAKFVPSLLYNSVFSHFVCYGYQVQIYIFFLLQAKKQKKISNCSGKRQSTWRRGMPHRHRREWPAWGRCSTKGNNLGTVFQTFTERGENNFFHVVFFSYLCTH